MPSECGTHDTNRGDEAGSESIAMRYQHLSAEIGELDHHLDQLVAVRAPALVAIKGVGTDIASTLLTIAGDNPERLEAVRVHSPTMDGVVLDLEPRDAPRIEAETGVPPGPPVAFTIPF